MAGTKYKDKSKEKGEKQYKNNRGVDAIGSLFGGMLKKAVKAKHKAKKRTQIPKD